MKMLILLLEIKLWLSIVYHLKTNKLREKKSESWVVLIMLC